MGGLLSVARTTIGAVAILLRCEGRGKSAGCPGIYASAPAFDARKKRPADCGFLAVSCIASPLVPQRFLLGHEVSSRAVPRAVASCRAIVGWLRPVPPSKSGATVGGDR